MIFFLFILSIFQEGFPETTLVRLLGRGQSMEATHCAELMAGLCGMISVQHRSACQEIINQTL